MSFGAVLFDLDGTLLDTLEDLAASTNLVLSQHGFPAHPLASYRYLVGDGVENLLRGALPEASRDDATVASCVAGMRAEYGRRWADQTCLYAGVPELLDGLTGRRVRMAILSNKPDDMTRVIAAHFLSAWRFEVVLGARSTVPRKPDPTAALEIARELGLPPREFLYLGDTRIDMETARGAGMSPVGALWGFRTAEELTASGATALLEKPADLLALV